MTPPAVPPRLTRERPACIPSPRPLGPWRMKPSEARPLIIGSLVPGREWLPGPHVLARITVATPVRASGPVARPDGCVESRCWTFALTAPEGFSAGRCARLAPSRARCGHGLDLDRSDSESAPASFSGGQPTRFHHRRCYVFDCDHGWMNGMNDEVAADDFNCHDVRRRVSQPAYRRWEPAGRPGLAAGDRSLWTAKRDAYSSRDPDVRTLVEDALYVDHVRGRGRTLPDRPAPSKGRAVLWMGVGYVDTPARGTLQSRARPG